jgi:hypothetical protein
MYELLPAAMEAAKRALISVSDKANLEMFVKVQVATCSVQDWMSVS